jgi:hypothetical protein
MAHVMAGFAKAEKGTFGDDSDDSASPIPAIIDVATPINTFKANGYCQLYTLPSLSFVYFVAVIFSCKKPQYTKDEYLESYKSNTNFNISMYTYNPMT